MLSAMRSRGRVALRGNLKKTVLLVDFKALDAPVALRIKGVGQAQNSRQLQDALPLTFAQSDQRFLPNSWQRATMIAGDDTNPAQLLFSPAQGRRHASNQIVGSFVMILFFPRTPYFMQQSGSLQDGALIGGLEIRWRPPDWQSVIKLKGESSHVNRVLEIRIEETKPKA